MTLLSSKAVVVAQASGSGSVGRVVASDTRDPRFKSQHRQLEIKKERRKKRNRGWERPIFKKVILLYYNITELSRKASENSVGAFKKGRRPADRKDRNDAEARHGGAARVGQEDRQRRRRRRRRQRRQAEEKEEFDTFEQKFDSAKQNFDNPEHVGPGFESLPRAIGCGRQGDAFPADQ